MKKLAFLFACLGLCATAYAAGNDNLKIKTVKQIYQYHIKTHAEKDTLGKFADSDLKRLRNKLPSDEPCIDWDVITDSQDPEVALGGDDGWRMPKITVLNNGNIRVKMHFDSVTYKLSCTEKQCRINDIIYKHGKLKDYLRSCR